MTKNSISGKFFIAWLPVLAAVTSLTCLADGPGNYQAQTQLMQLNSDYMQMLDLAPASLNTAEDIVLACDQTVFLEWADAYLSVLNSARQIDPASIGRTLNAFGVNYFQAKDDLPGFEYGRKGILAAIRTALSNQRPRFSVDDLNPARMNLADIQKELFDSNIHLCSQLPFLNEVTNAAPQVTTDVDIPANAFSGGTYIVTWVKSPSGGLLPVRVYPAASLISPFTRLSNYQSFLDAVHQHRQITFTGGGR